MTVTGKLGQLFRVALYCSASLGPVHAFAQSVVPAATRQVGVAVTPASAFASLGSATVHTTGVAALATRPPEIKSLARALSRAGQLGGDAFAQRVADYVRRNITTEFMFGLGKGARGALLDQSGTPFDQAELMVELLREQGQAASYQLGTITLDANQFGKWTGFVNNLSEQAQTFTVDARSACQMLADGGIPAVVNGSTSCASLSGNLTSATLAHVWVITNGKAYDPAFKSNILRTGIDVAGALGCGSDAAPTCGASAQAAALNLATQGTANGASFIQNVNEAGVEANIQAKALSLQQSLDAADPSVPLENVVGGAKIDLTQTVVASANLPYQTTADAVWTGAIPDQYRTTFRVQMLGLDQTLYADEITGQRITLATHADQSTWARKTGLYVEGRSVASALGTGASQVADVVTITTTHPFQTGPGYGTETVGVTLATDWRGSNYTATYTDSVGTTYWNGPYSNYYYLQLTVGRTGRFREELQGRLSVNRKLDAVVVSNTGISDGPAQGSSDVIRNDADVTAAKYLGQNTLAVDLVANVAKLMIRQLHTVGAIYRQMPEMRGSSHLLYNIRPSFAVSSKTSDSAREGAALTAAAIASASLEASSIQQSEDAWEAFSPFTLIKLANTKAQRFYSVNASNVSTVLAGTINYSAFRKSNITSIVNAGYNMIIPSEAFPGQFSFAHGAAVAGDSGELAYKTGAVGSLVSELFKGGGGVNDGIDPTRQVRDSAVTNAKSAKDKSYFGVDLASGNLNLTPGPDVGVGSGSATLSFRRTMVANRSADLGCKRSFGPYNTLLYGDCSALGLSGNSSPGVGWDHNFNSRATWSGSGLEGLGATRAIRAARAIAALYTIFDLSRSVSFPGMMTSAFVAYSLQNSFVRNSVSLAGDGEYVLLPSGRFDPPPGRAGSSLVLNGSIGSADVTQDGFIARRYDGTSIDQISPDGSITHYTGEYSIENHYAILTKVDANGLKQTRQYYPNSVLNTYAISSATLSTGDNLTFNYSNYLPQSGYISYGTGGVTYAILTSVTGNGAFSSAYDCPIVTAPAWWVDSPRCELTHTNNQSGATTYKLGSGDGTTAGTIFRDRVLTSWLTPGNTSTPYMNVQFDPALKLASYQDVNGHQVKVFSTNVTGDGYRLGEMQTATGSLTSNVYNADASLLSSTDALGQTTQNVYDNNRQLLRTIYPEGNAIEYAYDRRGNRVSECQIGKARVTWSTLTPLTEQAAQCNTAQGDLVKTTVYLEAASLRADQCANAKTCNKPSYVIDARGYRTDYTWSPVHGQLMTVTGPADQSGVRPVTTYGYTAFTGADGATFYLVTSKQDKISSTLTTTTTYEYDATNHWALNSEVRDNGGLSLRTCFKFDGVGNLISKTEPRAGLATCP